MDDCDYSTWAGTELAAYHIYDARSCFDWSAIRCTSCVGGQAVIAFIPFVRHRSQFVVGETMSLVKRCPRQLLLGVQDLIVFVVCA